MKKILLLLMIVFLILPITNVKADEEEVPIEKANGNGYVTYIGTNIQVTIPKDYKLPDTAFRAVWVSAFTGDISTFVNEAQYKREIIEVLEVMEIYNMNAMIFHIRARNDAFYESKYNKWSNLYNSDPSWDALPWIIEECHRRGIEFHAWLNPYRVATYGNANLETLSKNFKSTNPASNPDNLLNADSCVILNPGLPNVRSFLIKTCMEVIENYDVDAINFDDYFYAAGVDDSDTYAQYNPDKLSLADWRREQINLFIKGLSEEMRAFNEKTGRRVQLGIAPSGIWKSGNGEVTYDSEGNAITNGSATTSSFIHYGGHLFADTLKWINEEWIDYILPQTYWAIEHGSAGYPDLVDWWAKVVKYKKVNLYVSMGLYMRSESGASSWNTSDKEGYNQIMFANKLDTVQGTSVYRYTDLKLTLSSNRSFVGVKELWSKPAILPEVRTMDPIIIDAPTNLTVGKVDNGYRLTFNQVDKAKFYVVYRSKNDITYAPEEVIDIIGNICYDGKINYVDIIDTDDDYNYAIKAQSNSLTLTDGITVSTKNSNTVDKAPIDKAENILFSSNTIASANIDVKWDIVRHSLGDEIKYDVYYSTDNSNWVLNPQNIDVNIGDGVAKTKLIIPQNTDKVYLKVKSYNNVGESYSEVKTIQVFKSFGMINHFTYSGDLYTEGSVEFTWNNRLDCEGVTYTLQESTDLFTYKDITTVSSSGDTNERIIAKLPKAVSKYYYRIKAEWDGKIAFSEILTLEIKEDFGGIDGFKINGEKPNEVYILKEEEFLEIDFDYKGGNSSNVSYISKLSKNQDNWMLASKFYYKNNVTVSANKCKQLVYASGMDLKMYYYLEVNMGNKVSKTEVYEIYVIPEIIFVDDFSNFMNNEKESIIDSLNMFN